MSVLSLDIYIVNTLKYLVYCCWEKTTTTLISTTSFLGYWLARAVLYMHRNNPTKYMLQVQLVKIGVGLHSRMFAKRFDGSSYE